MSNTPDQKLRIKLLMLGDSGVGKSSILTRYTEKKFAEGIVGTAGIDFRNKEGFVEGKEIMMEIWDTAGQERFRTITSKYYHGAMGIILTYDITDRNSFDNINAWLTQIRANTSIDDIAIMICGNKTDLTPREISEEEAQKFADENSALFIETSAKNDVNIHTLFNRLNTAIVRSEKILAKNWNNTTTKESAKKPKRQRWIFACGRKTRK